MSGSIEFKADKLIKKLNLIEKVYLPQAAEQALKSFGFESRKTLADAKRTKRLSGRRRESHCSWNLGLA